ncbi:MAG: hypothetical protein VW625_01410 [Perlucidibaca sp.]
MAITTRIYSPAQITLGALWGGPIAATYFIHQNFVALQQARAASNTLTLGTLLNMLFLLGLPFLPEHFPPLLLPLCYSLITFLVVRRWQPDTRLSAGRSQLQPQSGWRVCCISLVALMLNALLAIMVMLILSSLGLLDLR